MTEPNSRSQLRSGRRPIDRVLILGCPGAGKTTLARTVGRETGLPVFHLDDHYWGPGWSRMDPEEWSDWQRALIRRKSWVIDGNYAPTLPLRMPNADLVVFVDTPTSLCLWRTLRRAWRIRLGQRQLLPARVREAARSGEAVPATRDFLPLLSKIVRFRRRDAAEVMRLAASVTDAPCVAAVVPNGFGIRDRVAAHRAHGRPGWTVLSLQEATRFVVESVRAGWVPPGRTAHDDAKGFEPGDDS